MNEAAGNFLSQQLYPDIKSWLTSLYKKFYIPFQKSKAPLFKSPKDLLQALKSGQVKPNSWIILECKPSMFGPFLRNHFISPVIGMQSDMRLGPQLLSEDFASQVIGNLTSHLKPIGLYPPIEDDLYQICLYPSDTEAAGFVGLFPGLDGLIEYIPAIASSKNLTHCGIASHVKAVVRQVDPQLLLDFGFKIEEYESLRQNGYIWFIDISQDEAEISPLGDGATTEMWGGLYASGHIEFDGELQIHPLIDGMVEAMKSVGYEPHVIQNQAARQEIMVFGKGIRATIETKSSLYSIHMDSELAMNFSSNKKKFDQVCHKYLESIVEVGKLSSTDIKNPHDLDFTYTDSDKAFTVLKSSSANEISDPLGIAIRDWHRKRGK